MHIVAPLALFQHDELSAQALALLLTRLIGGADGGKVGLVPLGERAVLFNERIAGGAYDGICLRQIFQFLRESRVLGAQKFPLAVLPGKGEEIPAPERRDRLFQRRSLRVVGKSGKRVLLRCELLIDLLQLFAGGVALLRAERLRLGTHQLFGERVFLRLRLLRVPFCCRCDARLYFAQRLFRPLQRLFAIFQAKFRLPCRGVLSEDGGGALQPVQFGIHCLHLRQHCLKLLHLRRERLLLLPPLCARRERLFLLPQRGKLRFVLFFLFGKLCDLLLQRSDKLRGDVAVLFQLRLRHGERLARGSHLCARALDEPLAIRLQIKEAGYEL